MYAWYPQRAGRLDLLMPRPAEDRSADAVVRQEAGGRRGARPGQPLDGRAGLIGAGVGPPAGSRGSLGSFGTSVVARAAARAHSLIGGAAGLLTGSDAALVE